MFCSGCKLISWCHQYRWCDGTNGDVYALVAVGIEHEEAICQTYVVNPSHTNTVKYVITKIQFYHTKYMVQFVSISMLSILYK